MTTESPEMSDTATAPTGHWEHIRAPWPPSERVFHGVLMAALVVLAAGSIFVLRERGRWVPESLRFMLDNLPLTLPVLSVVMGLMLRPYELRTVKGWLSISNHFAAGLVSFSIWAFVAGQGVEQFIPINPKNVLDKDFALLLVFGSFIWAGFCSVITALAEITQGGQQRVWRSLQVLLVAISLTLMFAPFQLFESQQAVEARTGQSLDERQFKVVIPFRDAGLNGHLGRTTDPLTQSQVYRGITARTPQEAIRKALDNFTSSDASLQFSAAPRRPDQLRRVEILEAYMVAAPEP